MQFSIINLLSQVSQKGSYEVFLYYLTTYRQCIYRLSDFMAYLRDATVCIPQLRASVLFTDI